MVKILSKTPGKLLSKSQFTIGAHSLTKPYDSGVVRCVMNTPSYGVNYP